MAELRLHHTKQTNCTMGSHHQQHTNKYINKLSYHTSLNRECTEAEYRLNSLQN